MSMSWQLYAAFVAACALIAVIPGPMVALVVANSLTHGSRAGLLNVAGSQLGLAVMMAALVAGLASLVEGLGMWFDWLRLAGAAYLVWIGWKMLRAPALALPGSAPAPRGGFFLQGFLVMMSNPKVLLFFGAFIPQFTDPAGDQASQMALLGATAMAIAMLSDSAYALLAARAGRLLSARSARNAARIGGLSLIGGGLWLALSRGR